MNDYENKRYGEEAEPNELDPIDLEDEDEAAGPLAEDMPMDFEDDEDEEIAEDDDIEKTPGIRRSGGADVAVMSHRDRRREFPSVGRRVQTKPRGRHIAKQRQRQPAR